MIVPAGTGRKKARERAVLDALRAGYPEFPSGQVTEGEEPDFTVDGGDLRTGIEVVDYVRGQGGPGGSALRRTESLWSRVANRAREIYEDTHSVPLLVVFDWNPQRHPSKSDVEHLAHAVTALVEEHLGEPIGCDIGPGDLEDSGLEELVLSVRVRRLAGGKSSLWGPVTPRRSKASSHPRTRRWTPTSSGARWSGW
jgi:hypothetical protein